MSPDTARLPFPALRRAAIVSMPKREAEAKQWSVLLLALVEPQKQEDTAQYKDQPSHGALLSD